ncbi:uncharacterized protein LOC129405118 [Sorex araneus]|uniref:uncharacterized protein LOC129405118 n=1 Tax=Sorex araneus TaxID=42254 RepID=UPI00243362FE|nr:uncharacterized protein LOC129405118 [Sorex araneus]
MEGEGQEIPRLSLPAVWSWVSRIGLGHFLCLCRKTVAFQGAAEHPLTLLSPPPQRGVVAVSVWGAVLWRTELFPCGMSPCAADLWDRVCPETGSEIIKFPVRPRWKGLAVPWPRFDYLNLMNSSNFLAAGTALRPPSLLMRPLRARGAPGGGLPSLQPWPRKEHGARRLLWGLAACGGIGVTRSSGHLRCPAALWGGWSCPLDQPLCLLGPGFLAGRTRHSGQLASGGRWRAPHGLRSVHFFLRHFVHPAETLPHWAHPGGQECARALRRSAEKAAAQRGGPGPGPRWEPHRACLVRGGNQPPCENRKLQGPARLWSENKGASVELGPGRLGKAPGTAGPWGQAGAVGLPK